MVFGQGQAKSTGGSRDLILILTMIFEDTVLSISKNPHSSGFSVVFADFQ